MKKTLPVCMRSLFKFDFIKKTDGSTSYPLKEAINTQQSDTERKEQLKWKKFDLFNFSSF